MYAQVYERLCTFFSTHECMCINSRIFMATSVTLLRPVVFVTLCGAYAPLAMQANLLHLLLSFPFKLLLCD